MKKYFLIITFFALLSFSGSVNAQEKGKPVVEVASDSLGDVEDAFQEYFFEALKQKAIENYGKAIDALLKSLSLEARPVVYLELGKNFNALQQFDEAAAYLETGRKKVPKNTAILQELYKSYFLSRSFEKALPVVKTLAILDTSYSEDLVNLQILNENFDIAIKLLDSLDAKKGSSTSRDSLRRQVYSQTNNVDAQLKELQDNIAKDSTDEKSYLNLIFVYSENGRPEEAFETAKKLLEMDPESELVHLALYKFHLNENETEEAVESMKVVLSSGEIDESTKYQALNDFLLYVSENPTLEDELITLVGIFSEEENNTKVYGQLGTFFLEKRKKEQALKYFELALETETDNFGLYRDVLELQLEFDKNEEAVALSDKALEIFPSQPMLYLFKGKALNELKKYREAEESLLFGLDYLIDDRVMETSFYSELVNTYNGLNEPEKASKFREKANEPEN
ncbi:tetratricopeptide repeat protein [Salinimicrobium gaetbulicola]|uniref:Tetratricopeptide repeat protein n=1 Tax=Salinimicrobium gaetbulicola TaxID=999702 RepID=A0ABW3IGZ0_9FLAO